MLNDVTQRGNDFFLDGQRLWSWVPALNGGRGGFGRITRAGRLHRERVDFIVEVPVLTCYERVSRRGDREWSKPYDLRHTYPLTSDVLDDAGHGVDQGPGLEDRARRAAEQWIADRPKYEFEGRTYARVATSSRELLLRNEARGLTVITQVQPSGETVVHRPLRGRLACPETMLYQCAIKPQGLIQTDDWRAASSSRPQAASRSCALSWTRSASSCTALGPSKLRHLVAPVKALLPAAPRGHLPGGREAVPSGLPKAIWDKFRSRDVRAFLRRLPRGLRGARRGGPRPSGLAAPALRQRRLARAGGDRRHGRQVLRDQAAPCYVLHDDRLIVNMVPSSWRDMPARWREHHAPVLQHLGDHAFFYDQSVSARIASMTVAGPISAKPRLAAELAAAPFSSTLNGEWLTIFRRPRGPRGAQAWSSDRVDDIDRIYRHAARSSHQTRPGLEDAGHPPRPLRPVRREGRRRPGLRGGPEGLREAREILRGVRGAHPDRAGVQMRGGRWA
jgi:hypothetical protein